MNLGQAANAPDLSGEALTWETLNYADIPALSVVDSPSPHSEQRQPQGPPASTTSGVWVYYPLQPPARTNRTDLAVGFAVGFIIAAVLIPILFVWLTTPTPWIAPLDYGNQMAGVRTSSSVDGTNWTVSFSSTPNGRGLGLTTLEIRRPNGSVALAAAPLSTYVATETNGVKYDQVTVGATAVAVGDSIRIRTALYPAGHRFEIRFGNHVMASGEFL